MSSGKKINPKNKKTQTNPNYLLVCDSSQFKTHYILKEYTKYLKLAALSTGKTRM